jgi:mannose-1-phosphate guanylyltransferase/mannose-6-phosphate isomerase-like protein (cupin superfamily)
MSQPANLDSSTHHPSPVKITPVILCGGAGTRLWPLSRTLRPKQFYPLIGEISLFQKTLQRAWLPESFTAPLIIANQQHQFLVEKELKVAGLKGQLILEPCVRNTTPAITLAALAATKQNPDAVLLVMPSDHLIEPLEGFLQLIHQSLPAALAGDIITFGIKPDRPETGYGYIQQGNFLWNAGIFLCQANTFLKAVSIHEPDVLKACEKALSEPPKGSHTWSVDQQIFSQSPSISVDYGIMERIPNIKVVPLTVNWSDLGSWQTLWEVEQQDGNGNTLIGDVVAHNVKRSYIRSEGRLVTVVGLEDIVVIDSNDAVLVSSRAAVQDVKKVVETLESAQRPHVHSYPAEERPWGAFQSIDKGERFQVKRITVNPGQKLSLQSHHHRAEHWVIVSGTAKVTLGEEESTLFENQSIYIPYGVKHRLENPGKIPLELIEIQTGSYLGEDDIIRFGDDYGRS